MKKKNIKYINNFFKRYTILKKKFFWVRYYIFIVSFFYNFLFIYTYLQKFILKDIDYFFSNIKFLFRKKNSFLLLENGYFISEGFFLNKKKMFFFFLKRFLNINLKYFSNMLNFYYLSISKKILLSYNFFRFYFNRCNKKIFKLNYFKIHNIFLKEKKIFGYMRKKKIPRKKKLFFRSYVPEKIQT